MMDEYFGRSPKVRKRRRSLRETQEHCVHKDADEGVRVLLKLREKTLNKAIRISRWETRKFAKRVKVFRRSHSVIRFLGRLGL
jgi:hypothetical protein